MQITMHHRFWRFAGWLACCAGMALGIALSIGVFTTGGQWWAAPIALVCCALTGGTLGVIWLNHSPKVTVTAEGILAKRFFRTRFYRWQDFIQAGVTWTRNKGRYYHEIVLLLPGGSKRNKYDVLFYLRNLFHILYLPYREDILIYLLQGYGKLDFYFTDGSLNEEYYTIEESNE